MIKAILGFLDSLFAAFGAAMEPAPALYALLIDESKLS